MHCALLVLTFFLLGKPFAAAGLTYCATQNTGASFQVVTNKWQSNGACEQTCASYALGVLQGEDCWCSNVAPAQSAQQQIGDCSTGCPGYPKDSCGSAAQGVFAYVLIPGKQVTSTAGGGGSSSTGTTSGQTTMTTSSATASSSTIISSSLTPTTSESSSSSSQTSQTTNSDTTTTTGSVVKETTAAGGVVKTITVSAPSPTNGNGAGLVSSAPPSTSNVHSNKLSGGSIAGIVIGVIAGLALLGALIFLIFFYRKRARAASPVPSQDMTDRQSNGSNFIRGFHGQEWAGPSTQLGRQRTFTDNRMKPDIYPNGPRDSSASLQDNEDYSRPVLRLTNPD